MKELKVRAYDKATETMIYSGRYDIPNRMFYLFGMDKEI